MKTKFDVTGMTCAACQAHVEKSVRKLPGVSQVNVNLLQNNMTVEYDDKTLGPEAIIHAVEAGGYGASLPGAKGAAGQKSAVDQAKERDPADEVPLDRLFCLSDPLVLPVHGPHDGLAAAQPVFGQ